MNAKLTKLSWGDEFLTLVLLKSLLQSFAHPHRYSATYCHS